MARRANSESRARRRSPGSEEGAGRTRHDRPRPAERRGGGCLRPRNKFSRASVTARRSPRPQRVKSPPGSGSGQVVGQDRHPATAVSFGITGRFGEPSGRFRTLGRLPRRCSKKTLQPPVSESAWPGSLECGLAQPTLCRGSTGDGWTVNSWVNHVTTFLAFTLVP